jgi:Zn-dependent protease with chaperone function
VTYGALGIALALAAFLIVDVLASLWAAALGTVVDRETRGWRGANRQRLLFAVRLLPAAAALVFVSMLVGPSYVDFEPRHSGEPVGAGLVLVAVLSGALVLGGLGRAAHAWWSVRRLTRGWLEGGAPLEIAGIAVPAFRIESAFPIVSVAGAARPRLFIASQVLEALSPEELQAVVAHESGHLRSLDNWKRLLLRACPDALALLPTGRRLEQAWAASAECAADEHAESTGDSVALHLAAALVKVARLAPPNLRAPATVSALHDGEDVGARVRRLIAGRGAGSATARWSETCAWLAVAALPLLLMVAAGAPGLDARLHDIAETIVRFGS